MGSIRLLVFGQLVDFTKKNSLTIDGANDTKELVEQLNRDYPGLSGISYKIAVDKKIIDGNTKLEPGAEVALLPPFAGG